jgi:hypothetical protein
MSDVHPNRSQVGIIGDHAYVEGGIHFHTPSPSPPDFTGREEELAHLCHVIEQEDVAERLLERVLQKNADLTDTTTRVRERSR